MTVDRKISELPSATATNVAQVFPIVQSSTTTQIPLASFSAVPVASIAILKTLTGMVDGQRASVSSYYAAATPDGGGGDFKWDAASSATDNGGTVIAPDAGGVGRWRRIYSGALNVRWFGAKGDNSNDDTATFAAAVAAGKHLAFPSGTFLVDTVALNTGGYVIECGGKDATILKGRNSSSTKILDIAGSGSYSTDNVIRGGLTLDMGNMTDADTRAALHMNRTWGNLIEKVYVTNNGSNKLSLSITMAGVFGTYTSRFVGCDFESSTGKIKIQGTSLTDAVTTLTFEDCALAKATIDSAWQINFRGCAWQGALDKFALSNVFNITVENGDIEGTGTIFLFGANCSQIVERDNNISSALTYSGGSTGYAIKSFLDGRQRGYFGKVHGKQTLTIADTNPNTIYTFTDVSSAPSYSAALMVVYGDDGTRGWTDLIMVSLGTNPVTISSNNTYGAGQPTRTYTYASASVKLTLSAVAAANVRTLILEYMGAA